MLSMESCRINIDHQEFAVASLPIRTSLAFPSTMDEQMQQITSGCTALQLEIESAVSQAALINSLH